MPLNKLAHYSIRTQNLEASERFYTDLLGFRVGFRPSFPFPGRWLYLSDDESEFGVVHLVGIDQNDAEGLKAYLGDREPDSLVGTGAIDHIAFIATGWPGLRARCKALDQQFVERIVPSLGLLQIFISDPSGIMIELNYPSHEA